MVKQFYFLAAFALLSLIAVFAHYFALKKDISQICAKSAAAVYLPELSLGAGSLQNRFLAIKPAVENKIYPQMPGFDKTEFIYGR